MATRIPAEVFPPGDFLREELEARGWTQADLADILGRDTRTVNEIVVGKRGITPETARGLAAAFGTSPEFWMRLEQAYQLWRVRDRDNDSVARRARIYSYAPISEMVRRGWIEHSENVEVLERRVLTFFGADNLDDVPQPLPHAARKSTSYTEQTTPAQRAWLARARQLAQSVHAGRFSSENIENVLSRLRLLVHAPQESRHVPRILSEAGIRFVVVQPLAGTRIDGACFWINGSPVIALSMRFDRIDNFWFTLLHELGHCSRQDVSLDNDLETSRVQSEKPLSERYADEFALTNLINQDTLNSFIARKRPLYSTRAIAAFAQVAHVHPGIVVGQLQYRGELNWMNFRKMLVPIREWITASALTDGWGFIAPSPT